MSIPAPTQDDVDQALHQRKSDSRLVDALVSGLRGKCLWLSAAALELVLKQNDARVRIIARQAREITALSGRLAAETATADIYRRALSGLVEAVGDACAFDGGEKNPEDAKWAAALDQLDNTCNEITDELTTKGIWP